MYIKKYSDYFKVNETIYNDLLYHGSPYKFFEFKNTTTFFSETEKFAVEYSETKSLDMALDNEPNLYIVKSKTDFFDITDKKDETSLKNSLPNEVDVTYNNFGFSAKIEIEELILNMKGFYTVEPYEEAVNASVGDIIPSPEYKLDKNYVFKKDDDYLYTYDYNSFQHDIEPRTIFANSYKEVYKPFINYIKEYSKKVNPDKKYFGNSDLLGIYYTLDGNKYGDQNIKVSEEDSEEFNKAFDDLKQSLIDERIANKYIKKFTLKTIVKSAQDSWRYYENKTVHNALVKLGYGGYIAKESGVKTFAIFNPAKDVNIIKFEFPVGTSYNTKEDFLNFQNFDKEVSEYMQKDNFFTSKMSLYYNRYDTYNIWREGKLTSKQAYDQIISDIKEQI